MIAYPETMNGYTKCRLFLLLMMYCMWSCDSSSKHVHPGFVKIISTACGYQKEIIKLEKKADECIDFAKAYKYATKARNLQKYGNEEIQRLYESMSGRMLIPVEQNISTQFYSLSGIEIISADLYALSLQAEVNFIKPANQQAEIFLCGIDENGTEIHPAFRMRRVQDPNHQQAIVVAGQLCIDEKYAGLLYFRVVDPISRNEQKSIQQK